MKGLHGGMITEQTTTVSWSDEEMHMTDYRLPYIRTDIRSQYFHPSPNQNYSHLSTTHVFRIIHCETQIGLK